MTDRFFKEQEINFKKQEIVINKKIADQTTQIAEIKRLLEDKNQ